MGEPREDKVGTCKCPYCDVEMEVREETIFCIACKTVIVDCVHCGEPIREGAEICPHCGEPPS